MIGQCDGKTYEQLLNWCNLNHDITHAKTILAQLIPELNNVQYAVVFPWHDACLIFIINQSQPIAAVDVHLNVYRLSDNTSNELTNIVKLNLNCNIATCPHYLPPFQSYLL